MATQSKVVNLQKRILDREFPKLDLRDVLGDELARQLMTFCNQFADGDREAAIRFYVRDQIAVSVRCDTDEPHNFACVVRDYDASRQAA